MRIDIITIFPEVFASYFEESLLQRAQEKKLLEIKVHNLRDWTDDNHKTVDDSPFGGGLGMVMKVEPIYRAVNALKSEIRNPKYEARNKFKILITKIQNSFELGIWDLFVIWNLFIVYSGL